VRGKKIKKRSKAEEIFQPPGQANEVSETETEQDSAEGVVK